MKPSFNRRHRRRSKPANNEGAFFKKESKGEQGFFGEAAHDTFFQPAVTAVSSPAVQRKCDACEHEEKNVQRATDKKEEDDKKLMRAEEKKEEDKKLQRAPEKKEEEEKNVQRATDKKEEDDKKLMRVEEKKEEDKKLQKKEAGVAPAPASGVSSYIGSLNGKGQSMAPLTNQFFTERMGYDFSQVKIHTDKDAAESAKSVNAKAYTIGNNIVFNEGQYNTESTEGKKLLAHELTHVVQQGAVNSGAETYGSIQRAVNYIPPVYTKGDPIQKVLGSANSKLGLTYMMLNGRILTTRDDMISAIFNAFNKGLKTKYDPVTKKGTVDTSNLNINVSADIAILTDPVGGKWSGQYPGSLVAGSPRCSQWGVVSIELIGTPNGSKALAKDILRNENEHYQDILTLSQRHLEAFYTYLQNISVPASSEGDAQLQVEFEIGVKDYEMALAFVDDWIAAKNVFDNPGGPHHYRSETNPGNCNPVTITVFS